MSCHVMSCGVMSCHVMYTCVVCVRERECVYLLVREITHFVLLTATTLTLIAEDWADSLPLNQQAQAKYNQVPCVTANKQVTTIYNIYAVCFTHCGICMCARPSHSSIDACHMYWLTAATLPALLPGR